MGRRKIEIKAIKDDRNRSVTFLKRKGGLFKKAHELSVLCSVDVAVIIFGHNKKLYEFSSGDINDTIGRYQYYGGAHEHKGPEDFMGKGDSDDENGEEGGGSPPPNSHSPPEHGNGMMPQHLQHQPQFQHIRHTTPSASPPMPNGVPFHHRGVSPQPPHPSSRPGSRTHMRRNSNLAPPQHHSQPPPPQNSYAYMPNPPFYNPQAQPGMPKPPPPPQPPQYQFTHPPPQQHPQVQYLQQQEQRRQSMPPVFSQAQERPQPPPAPQAHMGQPQPNQQQQQQQQPPPQHQHNQQQHQQQHNQPSPPQHEQNNFQSPPVPQPKALPASKKHSIFTPIDDGNSVLGAHWGRTTTEAPRSDVKPEPNRSQSIDVGAVSRQQPPTSQAQQGQQNGTSPRPTTRQIPPQPQRTTSTSSAPTVGPPSRANSMTNGPPRPRLKVQIPSEQSDTGSATADSSPKDTGTTGATPAKANTETSHSSGVVLPPPSPSASALLSAGASGPPNPFARPHPPGGFRDNMETPISALPSRFVENNLLPSPSSFYPEWGFGRETNMLPSPLTFQTPIVTNGPSFRDDDERKRKASDPDDISQAKRIKA